MCFQLPLNSSPDLVPAMCSGLYGLKEGLLQGPECHPFPLPVCFAFGKGIGGEQEML